VRANIAKISAGAPSIEFFEADLNSDQGWDRAVAGIDFVLHVASPVTAIDPKSDDELIRPARDGALRVLNAARDACVKRVVMTSSIAAIVHGHVARASAFTESDWTDETNRADSGPYDRSKTIAERAAWSWRDAQGGTLELVTINPSFVIGPVLGRDFSASLEIVKKLLDGSVPVLPRFGFDLIDVRDIARLHLLAMTTRSAAGQRFIGSGDYDSLKEIAGVLKQGLGKKSKESAFSGLSRLPRPRVRRFRPGCAQPVVRPRKRAASFIGESVENAGLDDASGFRKHPRHSPKSPSRGFGLNGR